MRIALWNPTLEKCKFRRTNLNPPFNQPHLHLTSSWSVSRNIRIKETKKAINFSETVVKSCMNLAPFGFLPAEKGWSSKIQAGDSHNLIPNIFDSLIYLCQLWCLYMYQNYSLILAILTTNHSKSSNVSHSSSERRGVPSRVRLGVAGADLPVRGRRGKDRPVVHGPGLWLIMVFVIQWDH